MTHFCFKLVSLAKFRANASTCAMPMQNFDFYHYRYQYEFIPPPSMHSYFTHFFIWLGWEYSQCCTVQDPALSNKTAAVNDFVYFRSPIQDVPRRIIEEVELMSQTVKKCSLLFNNCSFVIHLKNRFQLKMKLDSKRHQKLYIWQHSTTVMETYFKSKFKNFISNQRAVITTDQDHV